MVNDSPVNNTVHSAAQWRKGQIKHNSAYAILLDSQRDHPRRTLQKSSTTYKIIYYILLLKIKSLIFHNIYSNFFLPLNVKHNKSNGEQEIHMLLQSTLLYLVKQNKRFYHKKRVFSTKERQVKESSSFCYLIINIDVKPCCNFKNDNALTTSAICISLWAGKENGYPPAFLLSIVHQQC